MNIDYIVEVAENVRSEFEGKDIFRTAENAGANVWQRNLGGLKGFYLCENGSRYIIINSGLDNVTKRVVCAHELGHDMLHRELSGGGMREGTLFLQTNKTEREANLFAAEMLLTDKAVLSEISYNNSLEAAAFELSVPQELLQYKLEILAYKGYDVNFSEVSSDFLK